MYNQFESFAQACLLQGAVSQMSDMADGPFVQGCIVIIHFLKHLTAALTTYIIVGQSLWNLQPVTCCRYFKYI